MHRVEFVVQAPRRWLIHKNGAARRNPHPDFINETAEWLSLLFNVLLDH